MNEAKDLLNTALNGGLTLVLTGGAAGNFIGGNTYSAATSKTFFSNTSGVTSGVNVPASNTISAWHYWTDFYYPQIIHPSYPVYVQEKAKDNGKKAFEIIKILKDKKLVKLDKVSDFVDLMDELIKII